jgi:hypothetical protein
MSAENKKEFSEKKKTEQLPVNCKNDYMMVKEGIRVPLFVQNPEWHKKTETERNELDREFLKKGKIKGYRASAPARTKRSIPQRIVVHLKNLKKVPDFKTTYSEVLYEDQILNYMEMCFKHMKEEILSVYFHGKLYPVFL